MTEVKKLDKHTTKLYIEHATDHIGTNKVAELLGIKPSRVSDMKNYLRFMTVDEAEIIRSEFGLPSASSGIYIEGELLGKNWWQELADNSRQLHFARALDIISSDKFLKEVLMTFTVNELEVDGYDSKYNAHSEENRKAIEHKNERLVTEERCKLADALFVSDAFKQWHHEVIDAITTRQSQARDRDEPVSVELTDDEKQKLEDICRGISPHFYLYSRDWKKTFSELNFIAAIYKVINSGTYAPTIGGQTTFRLGQKLTVCKEALPIKDYVVSGRSVWESGVLVLKTPYTEASGLGWMPHYTKAHMSKRCEMQPKEFEAIGFELLYTEHYRYFVRVSLHENSHYPEDRILLIEIEDKRYIFDELTAIFAKFDLHFPVTLASIKSCLAENAAFIPNAIYLD